METIIRQALLTDIKEIWDFLKIAYGESAKYKIPERWNWEFIENPLNNKKDNKIPIFIAIKNGVIIGQACAILNKIKIGNEIYSSIAGCDLMVLPEHRKEGLAQKLIEKLAEHYKIFLAISYAAATKRIYDRMKHIKLEPVPTYFRFQRIESDILYYYLLQKTAKRMSLKKMTKVGYNIGAYQVISSLINIIITTRNSLLQRLKNTSGIIEIQQFDQRIDEFWDKISSKFEVIVKRNKEFLNWRFSDCPHLDYKKFICIRDGVITGYIVLRNPSPNELKIGVISDLLVDPDDDQTIMDLINYAITYFGKNVNIIECPTTQQEYQQILNKFGFIKIKSNIPILLCENKMLRLKLKNKWFITKADEDWDQLHPISELYN